MFSATLLTCNMHLLKCYHLLQTRTRAPPWRQLWRSPTSWGAEDGVVPTRGHLWVCSTGSQNATPDEGRSSAQERKPLMRGRKKKNPLNSRNFSMHSLLHPDFTPAVLNRCKYTFAPSKSVLIFHPHTHSESKKNMKDLQMGQVTTRVTSPILREASSAMLQWI